MRAGRLRHRLELQGLSKSIDGGDVSRTWSTSDTVWGAIEPQSSEERYDATQVEPETDTRIILRYRTDISADMRLKDTDTGTIYNIAGPPKNVGGRDIKLEIPVEEQN